ncbi:MAG: hypothetical protein K2X35_13715 [Bryobacteraceae bacterium]|nr:hypothetical protein [Bryobacteraceae bacterium]
MTDFEKLGQFYLGKHKDNGQILLYDSKDLVTHAVCVGMTGSGKTGLCIGLLEEAAIDSIPAIIIDPKGDLGNLLLNFPSLEPREFEPWVNADEARNKGLEVPTFAAQQAELWKKGLAGWGQDGARVQRLRDSAEFTIYTPGSDSGLPVSILKSFAAPGPEAMADRELIRDRISATATSLLGLVGIDADPIQSREHVLLSTLLDKAWNEGRDLDLAAMIAQIQNPPVARVGVMDLDSFYPAKDRFGLAMALNNLLASPGFESWLRGDPLDIQNMLYTANGRPRHSIFCIAHLSDAERMFFVSLLLNQVLSWVRAQSGTTSLRAILYMDEIFGYFPPVANPPSKKPLLTLLKQARAFGLGVVLATQNPVDLDYKGLANTGTWFIGRLQTERDKARVLEGLEGAASESGRGFDKQAMEQTLAGLGNRVFLMNNVHDDQPSLFQTRWTLSYLRGPLARTQIKQLMDPRKTTAPAAPAAVPAPPPAPAPTGYPKAANAAPVLPPDVPQFYIPSRSSGGVAYQPVLLGAAQVHFVDAKAKVDATRQLVFTTPLREDPAGPDWDQAEDAEIELSELEKEPADGASFNELPAIATKPKNYAAWQKNFAAWLFRTQKIDLFRSPGLGVTSSPGESERDFRIRLQQQAREERDLVAEKLRRKYGPKLAVLEERKRKAEQAVEKEKQQQSSQTMDSIASIAGNVLGAFLGRKTISATNLGRATSSIKAAGRIRKEAGDVARARETAEVLARQIEELNQEFEAEVAALQSNIDPATEDLEVISVKARKTNINVQLVALAWKAA